MVMGALTAKRIINRLYNAVRHSHSENRQRIPQAAHKQQVACIPNPLKTKWKHYFSPLGVQRFKVHRSRLSCAGNPGRFFSHAYTHSRLSYKSFNSRRNQNPEPLNFEPLNGNLMLAPAHPRRPLPVLPAPRLLLRPSLHPIPRPHPRPPIPARSDSIPAPGGIPADSGRTKRS